MLLLLLLSFDVFVPTNAHPFLFGTSGLSKHTKISVLKRLITLQDVGGTTHVMDYSWNTIVLFSTRNMILIFRQAMLVEVTPFSSNIYVIYNYWLDETIQDCCLIKSTILNQIYVYHLQVPIVKPYLTFPWAMRASCHGLLLKRSLERKRDFTLIIATSSICNFGTPTPTCDQFREVREFFCSYKRIMVW